MDDSPEKIERHYGNHVRIEPFYGDLEDRVLLRLATYLEGLATVENVRILEKRGWHHTSSEARPNQAPEPKTTVTPPAAQEPRQP